MGTFAKCIQDSRLVDIPLSRPFLKLMCSGDVVDNVSQNYRELLCPQRDSSMELLLESPCDDDLTPTEESPMDKELILNPPKRQIMSHSSIASSTVVTPSWYAGLLTEEDFELVDSPRARFLRLWLLYGYKALELLEFCKAIVWLQNKRDAAIDRTRGPSRGREDAHEYRVGRLKHERVTVPRDESLMQWATQVMKHHAGRKSILEVSFYA